MQMQRDMSSNPLNLVFKTLSQRQWIYLIRLREVFGTFKDKSMSHRSQHVSSCEKTPGRSQVFSTVSGGLTRSNRSGGGHLKAAWPVAALLVLSAALSGCGRADAQGGPPMAPPVSVAPAVQRPIQAQDEFTGRLEATETVDIRPRVGGTLEAVHFKAGDEVKRGQLLFTIDARPYRAELARAEAQLASARTALALATSEQARAQKLLAQRAISQQEADALTASATNNQSSVKAAEAAVAAARLNVEYSQIRAPIAGKTSRNNISVGNLVTVGDPVLTTLVSQDKVYAYFDVSEETYLRLSPALNGKTKPSVHMGLSNETGFAHAGVIDFFDNRLNPATASVRARAVFDNNKRQFTPGLLAKIKLTSGEPVNAVMTPEKAIGTDQNKRFVWVLGADKMPQFREVKLGALEGGMRVITEGLKAGELVVVNGLQRVRPGAPLNAQELKVDASGLPITPPPPAPGGAASAPAKKG
jgi:RND family efflux transporter MFP subunit